MPFDGAGFAAGDRVSKIDQVIDLLATPNQWCKAQFKTHDRRYCIRGAMLAVDGAEVLKPVVLQAICDVPDRRYLQIESFNDYPYTQYAEVLRVLHRARQLVVNGWTPGFPQLRERTGWSALLEALQTRLSQVRVPSH